MRREGKEGADEGGEEGRKYLAWNSLVQRECVIFSMESQRQCV